MFPLNHCTAFSDSKVKLLISSSRDFAVHEIVLLPVKLCNSEFSIQMLKEMKPKINSCETPDNKTWKNYMYYLSSLFVYNSLNMKKKYLN